MIVIGSKCQTMLQCRSRQPQVIGGYWAAFQAQLRKHLSIKFRGLIINHDNIYPCRIKKLVELQPVFTFPVSTAKTGKQFAENDRIDADIISSLKKVSGFGFVSFKSRVKVCIYDDPFHICVRMCDVIL